jgi:hypothetical protein
VLARLKRLFGREPEQWQPEQTDPRDEAELPAGALTGLTSPLDAGGDRAAAEPFDDEHS